MTRESAFDEIFDSQATFRVLLDCMSRPGTIGRVPSIPWTGLPADLHPAIPAVMKTLCDHRVSFAVGASSHAEEWSRYLELNLRCPARAATEASYVLMDGRSFDARFLRLNRGSLEAPEDSATVLLGVARLSAGTGSDGHPVRVSGPGVKDVTIFRAEGLDLRYLEGRATANAFYPMGIDILLVDRDWCVVGIPRTSRLEAA